MAKTKTPAQAAPDQRSLTLEKLVIVDKQGRPLITLGPTRDGSPCIAMLDRHGSERLTIALDESEPNIITHLIFWNQGNAAMVLGGGPHGPHIDLYDSHTDTLLELAVEDDKPRMLVGECAHADGIRKRVDAAWERCRKGGAA